MVAYTKPRQMKKESGERLRGERDQMKFIDLKFGRWQVVRFRKHKEGKTFHKLHVLGMNADLWDKGLTTFTVWWTGRRQKTRA